MTQEEKLFLLKDLCARLPYGLCIEIDSKSVDGKRHTVKLCEANVLEILSNIETLNVQPILRPMSSMTEEEIDEFTQFDVYSDGEYVMPNYEAIDWLNKHHFDYRIIYDEDKKKYMSMIEKGLAIEVTEENNPYKE